jgi:signal transduction histidine kinase
MIDTKILVVEDEAIVAEDIASRLENMGYVVADIVASGEAAIAAATESSPNLVLMDIMLRGEMDGVEAAQRIHQAFKIPVIYLTANADETTLQRAKLTEPFGYLLKPFKEKELKATIEIALARHEAEVQVQKALAMAEHLRQEAQQLSTLKSHFISMASHEFRTPLAVIKVATEILQHYDHRLPEDKKTQHFQRIQAATDSINQLLEDVLTLGQVDSGNMNCSFSPIDVVDFCQELLEAPQWQNNSTCLLKFVNQCGDQRQAWLDEKLLWHLLNNLLSNAIKYSPQGGTVILTVSQPDELLCFEVQDQGIGIPLADQKTLFEPFHRAANVGRIPGTGLGLAIAKRSVELHRGEISIQSTLGEGTTFTVKLPRKPPS